MPPEIGPQEFGYLEFSRGLVQFGGVLAFGVIVSVLLGHWLKDRRLVLVARRMMISASVLTMGAAGGLIAGIGRVEGQECMVVANDATVKAALITRSR